MTAAGSRVEGEAERPAHDPDALPRLRANLLEENAALRAEVERLTEQLAAIRRGNAAVSRCDGAAAALPTPAPEATDG